MQCNAGCVSPIPRSSGGEGILSYHSVYMWCKSHDAHTLTQIVPWKRRPHYLPRAHTRPIPTKNPLALMKDQRGPLGGPYCLTHLCTSDAGSAGSADSTPTTADTPFPKSISTTNWASRVVPGGLAESFLNAYSAHSSPCGSAMPSETACDGTASSRRVIGPWGIPTPRTYRESGLNSSTGGGTTGNATGGCSTTIETTKPYRGPTSFDFYAGHYDPRRAP